MLLPDDVIFHALPISHSFGLISALLCGLRAGATLAPGRRFRAEKLAEAIAGGVITVFQGVPAMYARLHEWAAQTGRSLVPNRLRMAYIGGSQIDATRKAQTEALLGLRLHHGYGLTESAPAATRTFGHAPPRDSHRRLADSRHRGRGAGRRRPGRWPRASAARSASAAPT